MIYFFANLIKEHKANKMTSKRDNEPYMLKLLKWTKLWVWADRGHTYKIEDNKFVPVNMRAYVELAEILEKDFILKNVKCENLTVWGCKMDEKTIWEGIENINKPKKTKKKGKKGKKKRKRR